ncbi:MAG: histidine phosphatase family protein [Candidatus Eremiobacteraeota bacterium]|nr:histidine phosphatase family protein [Candidatus Eremiobacteraeota bacterium]
MASRLSRERIDAIYASDLSRALDTARAIAAPHALDVASDPRLREFAFGAWEGLTWAEVIATRPHLQQAGWTGVDAYTPEGGETFAHVRARVAEFVRELAPRHPAGHLVIVTHAGAVHAAMQEFGFSNEGVTILPASLTRFAMEDGRARLITVSDVRHHDSSG